MPPLSGVGDRTTTVGLIETDVSVMADAMPTVKCVLVGDGAVGKTSLLVSYAMSECPPDYVPTAFDNYAVVVRVGDKPIRLQLCDTAGQLELDSLRTLCYSDADVFLVCFNIACCQSYDAVWTRWMPEIRRRCPSTPVILVGTQTDRRHSSVKAKVTDIYPPRQDEFVVPVREASELAERIGALAYMECSASLQLGVKDVFDSAIVVTLQSRGLIGHPKRRRGLLGVRRKNKCNKLTLSQAADDLDLLGVKRDNGGKRRWKQLFCCYFG